MKIQTLFHKTDPTGTLNGLRSTKPREFILQGISTHSHAQPRAQNAPRLSLSIPCKYARYFRTRTKPLDPAALYRQNPKISGLKKPPRAATLAKNVRRSPASILRALTRNHNSSRAGNSFTRVHAPSSDKRTQFHDVMDDVTPTNRFDRPGNRTRSEPPAKKKKKKRERENALTWWTFDLDQKVKIFKTDLSHSIFRVHFEFGTHFFIRNSEIVQMSSFQKLTFAQMLTKK